MKNILAGAGSSLIVGLLTVKNDLVVLGNLIYGGAPPDQDILSKASSR